MKRPLKILLLGDYSNCHRTLASGLRNLGCDVILVSDGSKWMDCERDVNISRTSSRFGGLHLYMKMRWGSVSKFLEGNDVVAINDLNFAHLKPQRLRVLFDRLIKKNRSVFLTSMSTDIAFLDMLEAADSPLRYSEWFVNGNPSRMFIDNPKRWDEWHNEQLVSYQRDALSRLDGATSVLYEYQLGMERALGPERAVYCGLPIDTKRFRPQPLPERPRKTRLFLGRDRHRKLMKGSDLLEIAARKVVEKHPDRAELVIVENRPFNEFVELLKSAHVVLDQIYSYTPATTALMAMAYGLNVVSGAEPEFYDFIGERDNRPIINAPIELDALTDTIESVVMNPQNITIRGKQSREFVVKHNDVETVARRCLDFWIRKLEEKKC